MGQGGWGKGSGAAKASRGIWRDIRGEGVGDDMFGACAGDSRTVKKRELERLRVQMET